MVAGIRRSRERADSWQFPLLLKYRIPLPVVKPYVEAGWAHRRIRGVIDNNDFVHLLQSSQPLDVQIDLPKQQSGTNWRDSDGIVSGSGTQFAFGRLLHSRGAVYVVG